MPELPEVERARALIAGRALGRVIAHVDDSDTFVCRPHAPGEIAAALEGATLEDAHRRGKAMWVETSMVRCSSGLNARAALLPDGGPVLGLHLGMAGRIVIDEPPAPNHWDRFSIGFEDGGRLALRDKRRLGRAVLDPDMSRVGPDAAEISREEFRRRVGRGTAPLKARIMDQAAIAGVGNLLADQTLWQAGLSPLTPAGELDDAQLDALRRTLRSATRSAVRKGGVHTGDFIEHRRRDGRCPRCASPLERATVGGRTTYWCPVDQPG